MILSDLNAVGVGRHVLTVKTFIITDQVFSSGNCGNFAGKFGFLSYKLINDTLPAFEHLAGTKNG